MEKTKKIWIFAGESSGDAYGAEIARSIKKNAKGNLLIFGMGGQKMRSAGVEIMIDSSELGVVGFTEVFSKIFTFIKIFIGLVKRAEREKPDAVVLIDYPGFNLRFAREMKKRKIPVIWYISPQVWAWGKKRIPKLAEYCRKMLVIFPFEIKTYAGTGLDVEFVGHPLVDIVQKRKSSEVVRDPNLVLILPGSRQNEINKLFIPFLETILVLSQKKTELRFAVSLNRETIRERCRYLYEAFKKEKKVDIKIDFYCGKTDLLMQEASAGIAASGTVTVEAAIAGLPLVVAYKVNPLTYYLGKMLVSLPYFTMVNIICGELVFKEYLQDDVNPATLSTSLLEILPDGARHTYVERKIREMTEMISTKSEAASDNAARAILKVLQEQNISIAKKTH